MSRLTRIELINFMSLAHAVFDFDERGIVSPVGYNDSGKSAVTRSLEVLWFDAYSQSQAKFITDGEQSFLIKNYFDDGVEIARRKFISGQSLWTMLRNGTVVYSNQLANGSFASVKGVPDAIAKYLGVVQDDATGEILNIRRNTNKLLLVATTGGENYKIFNNLCQGERLAFAVAEVNKDINTRNRQLTSKESQLIGMRNSAQSMEVFDEDTEKALLASTSALADKTAKFSRLTKLAEQYNAYADVEIAAPVPTIDLSRLELLLQIKQAYTNMQVEIAEPVPTVDAGRFEMLQRLSAMSEMLNDTVAEPIVIVSTAQLTAIQGIITAYNKLKKSESEIDYGKKWLFNERNALAAIASQNSWRICPDCGAIVGANDTCHAATGV